MKTNKANPLTDVLPITVRLSAGDIYERRTQHWVITREVTGMNGIGCPWLKEHWDWPTGGRCRTEILTLSYEQTLSMLKEFECRTP
jgi:hypothetical protein